MNIFQDIKDIKNQLSMIIRNNENNKKYINYDIDSSRKDIMSTNNKIDEVREDMQQQNELMQANIDYLAIMTENEI